MCGIIGIISRQNVKDKLIDGLKRLEYRGYDSVGLALINNARIHMAKKKGRVAELESEESLKALEGTCGIAHTRWATHGSPSEINAHPHTDCQGQITLVHNGIIENYQALKDLLVKEGHRFRSHTDTEVLSHLIEKFYQGDLSLAVKQALRLVTGAFGIVVIHPKQAMMVAARKGSPLVVGLGKGEYYIASDAPAILPYTQEVIHLEEEDLAVLSADSYSIGKLNGEASQAKISKIKWSLEQIEKGGYKFFMLKEIFEQPLAIENTLRGRLKQAEIKLSVTASLKKGTGITILGCGTSYHAGLVGKYIFEELLKVPVEVDYASEFRYRQAVIKKGQIVIAISQSGETADTLAALRLAKERGAQTVGIVNVVGSSVAREVGSGIYLHAGAEVGVASTKAFTCQITALILLAAFFVQQQGRILDKKLLEELKSLAMKIRTVLSLNDFIRAIAKKYYKSNDFLYLGRHINYPTALEGALKLKEISYIHAEGYPAAEMKHGPIALVDEATPSIFIVPTDELFEKNISNIQEIRARGGRVIILADKANIDLMSLCEDVVILPQTHRYLFPIISAVALQLFAYHCADLLGLDADQPRNLAKSVTVE